jgi:large subunit ribosomal protein L6
MLVYKLNQEIKINWGNDYIQITGPKGILIKRKSGFSLALKDNNLYVWSQENPEKEGAYLAWLEQMIIGVTKGYRQKLRLVGVGFRASLSEKDLVLKLGYSHQINYPLPKDVSITVSKAKATLILLQGIEKQRLKQVAVDIRNYRVPDAYKGKGIHYYKEKLKLKKGKESKR